MSILDAILGRNFQRGRRVWSAKRARAVRLEDARIGDTVRITGRALPADGLGRTPFTGVEAIVWRSSAEEKRLVSAEGRYGDRDETRQWVPQFEDQLRYPFFIVGDMGLRALVDVRFALVAGDMADVTGAPAFQSADVHPALDAYLRKNGYLPNGFMGIDGDHRFFEASLRPGDPVSVFAELQERAAVASDGYRDAPQQTLHLAGSERRPPVLMLGTP